MVGERRAIRGCFSGEDGTTVGKTLKFSEAKNFFKGFGREIGLIE